MKSPKLTVTERRSAALCADIRRACQDPSTRFPVTVEWIASRTWGLNPRIMHNGEKCTNISGCGYCKLSACLATALCSLGETEEHRQRIATTAGAGVPSVVAALKESGWILEAVASGKIFDCYTIRRA